MMKPVQHDGPQQWSSRWAFTLAAIGFSVGLGNIWRFPYLAGENGGGAFILIYLVCVLVIGLPIVIAELSIGRMGQHTPPAAMARVASESGASRIWSIVGWVSLLSAFLITSFYCVIGGWTLHFLWMAVSGGLAALPVEDTAMLFDALLANPREMILWQGVFIALNAAAVGPGLQGGLERVVTVLMPVLFLLLAGLAVVGFLVGDGVQAANFLFVPDFDAVTTQTWINALGQAFFSVGVGLGAMMTYGASLPKSVNIPATARTIVFADTLVAIVAGFAIFPMVFALGLSPSEGPGLVFVTLPAALLDLGGAWLTMAFFGLLSIAALTSSIAIFHMLITRIEESGLARGKAAMSLSGTLWIVGLGTVASFTWWQDVFPLSFLPGYEDATVFDAIDKVTSTLMLPAAGLLVAWFAGRVVRREIFAKEMSLSVSHPVVRVLRALLSWPVPIAIAVVLVAGLVL